MGASGTATLDFGVAANKAVDASVAVTGQPSIGASSLVEAWIMGESTTDHNEDEHLVENLEVKCGIPTAGVGFTIYGKCTEGDAHGQFKVKWVWN